MLAAVPDSKPVWQQPANPAALLERHGVWVRNRRCVLTVIEATTDRNARRLDLLRNSPSTRQKHRSFECGQDWAERSEGNPEVSLVPRSNPGHARCCKFQSSRSRKDLLSAEFAALAVWCSARRSSASRYAERGGARRRQRIQKKRLSRPMWGTQPLNSYFNVAAQNGCRVFSRHAAQMSSDAT